VAHVHAVRAALEDHVARIEWPRERIERYRTERLRALLAYARKRSPFHAARMAELDPSTATVADLARLPPMVKQEAQDEWDAIVTVAGLDRAGAERVLAELFVTLACLAWRMQAREERRWPAAGVRARLAVLEAGEPPHASTPLFDVAIAAPMDTVVIPAGAPFDELLAAVADARPTHLVGYASVIGRLARAALAGELDIQPVRVSTNSEPLSEEDHHAIQRAWRAPVHNLWGSTEIGVQAVGCGHGDGLHVCEDEVVLERVDESGIPVAPDQPAARTLATGLANRTFPFIRYDLGDEVTLLPGSCPCGSPMLRVADIAGRRDDDFHYGAHTVPASAFRHVLGTNPRISEYQVRQTTRGAEVLVVGSPEADQVTASLTAALRRHGLAEPEIQVSTVRRIERHERTGKLRRFIALSA
jgi:phenylacetate-coenzyme A ligase PaaK-like adenylate-forming protein